MIVYVLTEYDENWKSAEIIGVCDSPDKAQGLIDGYYGNDIKEYTSHRDIRESGIEWDKWAILKGTEDKIILVLSYYTMNEV